MSVVRRSLLFSALDRYLAQVLLIATTAVMARLLTPAETGVFLVAQATILLVENFREFGVGAYIVQERQLSREAIRSACTVTMLLSLAMCGALYLGAGWIARFYEQPELRTLLIVATFSFLLVPVSGPIMALLRRELAFSIIAAINVAVALTNALVTVVLGMLGHGPVSYVWGSVAASALLALLAFAARPQPWMFRPSFVGCRSILAFGTISSAVAVVNLLYDLLPRLLLGKILGFDAVGLYGRALTVCQLPDRIFASALQPVVLPAMAARVRDGDDLKHSYLRGHALISGLQWPALMMLVLLADPVVRVLLGPQWVEVVPHARLMALAMLALAPAFMTYPLLVSLGRIREALLASLISLPPSFLVLAGAASVGLGAVAASMLVTAPLQMVIALLFVRRAVGLSWAELAQASRSSAVVATASAAVPAVVVVLSPTGFTLDLLQTLAAAGGGALGWFAGVWLVDHPLKKELVAAWRLVREFAGRQNLSLAIGTASTVLLPRPRK